MPKVSARAIDIVRLLFLVCTATVCQTSKRIYECYLRHQCKRKGFLSGWKIILLRITEWMKKDNLLLVKNFIGAANLWTPC